MNNNYERLLGVNIDHVATLRQARGTSYPRPVEAAVMAEQAGAVGGDPVTPLSPARRPRLPGRRRVFVSRGGRDVLARDALGDSWRPGVWRPPGAHCLQRHRCIWAHQHLFQQRYPAGVLRQRRLRRDADVWQQHALESQPVIEAKA